MNIQKPFLFVDGSYYIFYRYYATMTWWSKQDEHKHKEKGKAMSDPSFSEKYRKMFTTTLKSLMKVHEVPFENVIIAKDCSRCDIWRNELYKEYKASRDEKLQTFDSSVFTETYATILPETGLRVMELNKLEADDIIAILVKHILTKNSDADITIITNDNDYIQLLKENQKLLIVNLQGKQIKDRIGDESAIGNYLMKKIIMGDKSDNIPSIMKSCGPKTAERLSNNPEELEKVFVKNPAAKIQFELNQKLIDFDKIPQKLSQVLVTKIDKMI